MRKDKGQRTGDKAEKNGGHQADWACPNLSFVPSNLSLAGRGLRTEMNIAAREWDGILEAFRDVNLYQTREYEAFHRRYPHTENVVLFDGNEPVAATQIRVIQLPATNVGVAYVFRGPLWRPYKREEDDPAALREMIRVLHGEFVVRRGLMLRLLLELRSDEAAHVSPVLAELGFLKRPVTPYRTFVLNLGPPMEVLRKNLAHPWRTNLNKAERRDFVIAAGTSDDLYGEFLRVYDGMVVRKKFDQRVDVEEFRRLQRRLPEKRKMTILICRFDGEPVAAGVCATLGATALQVFLATSQKALEVQGAYKLLWEQIRLLKESGAAYYDIGGVDRVANPGGYQFKSGLSGQEIEFVGEYEACKSPLRRALVHGGEAIKSFVRQQAASWRNGRP